MSENDRRPTNTYLALEFGIRVAPHQVTPGADLRDIPQSREYDAPSQRLIRVNGGSRSSPGEPLLLRTPERPPAACAVEYRGRFVWDRRPYGPDTHQSAGSR